MKLMKLLIAIVFLAIMLGGCDNGGDEHMTIEKAYYDEWIDYTAEELQDIFWEHEEAFDYIAQVILSLDDADYYIVIDDPQTGNLLFCLENANESFHLNDPDSISFTDGSDLGYTKDTLFEQYVNEILVGEKLSQILVSRGSFRINFGHNSPIYYNEHRPPLEKNNDMWGNLKENWFYYIQSYV